MIFIVRYKPLLKKFMAKPRSGISLVETLVGLTLFSILVIPLAMLPIQAMDISEEDKASSILNLEMKWLLNDMQQNIGQAYRFQPEVKNVAGFNAKQQLFIAYWDDSKKQVKRIGYTLRETSSGSNKWQLLRADIPENADIMDYQVNDTTWKPTTKAINGNEFYLTTEDETAPQFLYCKNAVCDKDVIPDHADGVRLQGSGDTYYASAKGVRMVYRNSDIPFEPMYFKLASLQPNDNRNLAQTQLLPFAMSVKECDASCNWLAEKTVNHPALGNYNIPIASPSELGQNGVEPLSVSDFHYNYRTGELITVSESPGINRSDNAQFSSYIFKSRPGSPDQGPYRLQLFFRESYIDNFPLIISRDDPMIPQFGYQGETAIFRSVTQDNDDNIYVLTLITDNGASAGGFFGFGMQLQDQFFILKFSPEGQYISRFHLGSDVANHRFAIPGITYNPATPNEIYALVRNKAGNFVIRAYPKDQDEDDPDRVIISANSEILNNPNDNSKPNPDIAPGQVNWFDARGLEYDPLHNRFIILFSPFNENSYILSLDHDLKVQTGLFAGINNQPVSRAKLVPKIYLTNSKDTLQNSFGIAYNPLSNQLYIGSGSTYYSVIPNNLLNVVAGSM